jgi:hypothetical protein
MFKFNRFRLFAPMFCVFAVMGGMLLVRPASTKDTSTIRATLPPLTVDSSPVSQRYLNKPSFEPSQAKFIDLINKQFNLTDAENNILAQNGFVISDRLAYENFIMAYAYIYKYDLPVLITTDSMLYAVHKGYDKFMQELEEYVLPAVVFKSLKESRDAVRKAAAANTDERLKPLYADLDLYLTVPMVFLSASENDPNAKYRPTPAPGTPTPEPFGYDIPNVAKYVQLARDAGGIERIDLFGEPRKVDFTLFKPRSRYTRTPMLSNYFRAMSWLIQVDFRLLDIGDRGQTIYNPNHAASAYIFEDALRRSGTNVGWQTLDQIFTELVGTGGNITLPNLKQLLTGAGIKNAADAFSDKIGSIIDTLNARDYGQRFALPVGGKRPTSFRLVGARYTIDSSIMMSVVYNAVDERPFPSPFDVMYALGNARAIDHLKPELQRYNYQPQLDNMRKAVEQVPDNRWSDSFYNRWLHAIRALNRATTSKEYPQSMRTAAWADKTLHTQLSAWAQLRHDNILLVPPTMSMYALCEYPAGYVEPYPAFYAAIADYARNGQALFKEIGGLTTWAKDQEALFSSMVFAASISERASTHLQRLEGVSRMLQTMAEKELRLEPFTRDENLFLRSVVVRKYEQYNTGCVLMNRETWDGWYYSLFQPFGDGRYGADVALIADVHTNPNTEVVLPPGVLHVGIGDPATMIFIGDTDEGAVAYVGPSFTFYERLEIGLPPRRLTDEDWKAQLRSDTPPKLPEWTLPFRVPSASPVNYLQLPTTLDNAATAVPQK